MEPVARRSDTLPSPVARQLPLDGPNQTFAAAAAPLATCSALDNHVWGTGLSVTAFRAVLEQLPNRRRTSWSSVYPPIGSGTRGTVYQAANKRTGGALAVKVIKLRHHLGADVESGLRREALVRELQLLGGSLGCKHLLSMQGFWTHGIHGPAPVLEIYSELGVGLEDMLGDSGSGGVSLVLVQKVARHVVRGLATLHAAGLVHRDVKAGNIISTGADGTFKLIDLESVVAAGRMRAAVGTLTGAAAGTPPDSSVGHAGGAGHEAAAAGTPDNLPPEQAPTVLARPLMLFDLLPLREGRLAAPEATPDPSWDVWALGTVVWEMLQGGRALFGDFDSVEDLYDHLGRLRDAAQLPGSGPEDAQALMPPFPVGIDDDARNFLEACLRVSPSQRATAQQLLGMAFLSKHYE